MKVPDSRAWRMTRGMCALLLLSLLLAPGAYAVVTSETVRTPHVEVQVIAEKPSIAPGETVMLGLRMKMAEGWHTYWKHPGDSGEATLIEWELPPGFTAGEIVWPHPEAIDVPPLTSYGYSGEVLLMVPLTAPADAAPGTTVTLVANAYWMACEKTCIPEEARLRLQVPVAAPPAAGDPLFADLFARTRSTVPVRSKAWDAAAHRTAEGFVLTLSSPSLASEAVASGLRFFAADGPLIEYAARQAPILRDGDVTIALKKSPYLTGTPTRMRGVVVGGHPLDASGARAIEIDVPIGAAPVRVASTASALPSLTIVLALGLAFAGGVILNLMPCVFPVVSLKVIGFVEASRHDPRRVRLHGLSFAAGVLVAFWILAGLLIGLRAAGEEIGWGFQLQSPPFVAVMALLIFVIGLALAGVMEIGASLTRLGAAERRGGLTSSMMNGMLATVVATPCTAPFMGAALGYALTQPAAVSLLIFTVLGAGMALPYVALSAWPSLLRFLPRPGAWMERFKQAMAFPLFATTAWLVWVFGIQTGVDGVLRLLIALTLVALAAWITRHWGTVASSTRTRWVARAAAATVAIAALGLATSAKSVSAAPVVADDSGIAWQAYSPALVNELRAARKPVFIDFTAAWCLSCKVNERVAFSSPEVHEIVRKRGIAMVKADWTNRNPEITRALAEFGRSGVPLYILYGSDPAAAPEILPEVLTPGIVIAALEQVR